MNVRVSLICRYFPTLKTSTKINNSLILFFDSIMLNLKLELNIKF